VIQASTKLRKTFDGPEIARGKALARSRSYSSGCQMGKVTGVCCYLLSCGGGRPPSEDLSMAPGSNDNPYAQSPSSVRMLMSASC